PVGPVRRAALAATVTVSGGSVAAMTVPYLTSWGPVLLLVAVAATATGTVLALRGANDPAARNRFVAYAAAHQHRLLGTPYLLCGDRIEAHRLVRAVLARVFLAAGRLADPVAIDAFARRALVLAARRATRGAEPEPLWRKLYALPARERAALVLTYHD